MAYLHEIKLIMPRCDACGAKATDGLYSEDGSLLGHYCPVHSTERKEEADRREKRQYG